MRRNKRGYEGCGGEEGAGVGGMIVLIMGSSKGEGWDGRDRQDFSITKGRLSVRRGRPSHTPPSASSSPGLAHSLRLAPGHRLRLPNHKSPPST